MSSKKHLWILLLIMSPIFATAQDFLGIKQSDYSGIFGVDANPGNIADNRYMIDVNLFGMSNQFYNNYMGIQGSILKGELANAARGNGSIFDDPDWVDKYVDRDMLNENNRVFMSNEIYGPGFMFGLKGGKFGVGMTSKIRNFLNVDGIGSTAAQLFYTSMTDSTLHYGATSAQRFENDFVNVQSMTWAEWGLNFGMVIKDDNEHFFKAGVRVKLLQGLQASYMYMNNVEFLSHSDSTISLFSSSVNYGHSDNYAIEEGTDGELQFSYFPFTSKPGLGLDIGGVYEWRPDWKKYKYDIPTSKPIKIK